MVEITQYALNLRPVTVGSGRLADCYYAPGSPRYSKMVDTWRGGKYWLRFW